MPFLALSHGYSGLAMLTAVRKFTETPITAAVLDSASARAARAVPALRGLDITVAKPARDGRLSAISPLPPASAVLSLFWPGEADVPVPVIGLQATGGTTERAGDPLPWALAAGQQALTFVVRRSAPVGVVPSGCAHTLPLSDHDGLGDAAEAVAKSLISCLGSSCGSPDTNEVSVAARTRRQAASHLPVPSRLDWAAPTSRIINLVRAYQPPAPGAWTSWHDLQLFVTSAVKADDPGGPVLPGTVLETSAAGILVATSDGTVRISGLRDIIGSVDSTFVAPGDVLGGDPAEDIRQLQRQLRDLECVVRRLAADVDFL